MAYLLRFDGGANYVEFDSPLSINNSTVYIKFKSGIQDRRRFILGTGNSAFYIRINNGLLEYGLFGRSGSLPTPVQENNEYTLRISHDTISFEVSEPSLGSVSDTGTTETTFSFIGRWFTGSDLFNGDIFYIKKYDFTEENLLANYEKQTLIGANDTTLPDTVGGNNGTLVNFPTDDSQWVFYSDATGVAADVTESSTDFSESSNLFLTVNITAHVTELLSDFSESSLASLAANISAQVTEVSASFTESSSATITNNIVSVSATETSQDFSESASASITGSLSALVTELSQSFTESSSADISANISAAITELAQEFNESAQVNLTSSFTVEVTETTSDFEEACYIQLPVIRLTPRKTISVSNRRSSTIRVRSRNNVIRVK